MRCTEIILNLFWFVQSELEEEVEEACAAAVAADPEEAAAMSQAATHLHNLYAPKPPHYEVSTFIYIFKAHKYKTLSLRAEQISRIHMMRAESVFVSPHRDSANRSTLYTLSARTAAATKTARRPDLRNKTPNAQALII